MTERDGVDLILEQWRNERPDLDSSPIGVVGRVSRLARELEQRLEPVYREHGLEPGWHDVLATLRRSGPPYRLRPSEFTGALMLTSSGTTKRLDRLEQAGLITRAPDPDDRRGTLITLTAAGRALIDSVTEAHLANERRLLSALTDGGAEPARRPPAQAPARPASALTAASPRACAPSARGARARTARGPRSACPPPSCG